ncbi:DEAD/DEAH box helicase [Sporocytophaga myxococcoides]|uniref:DEAD/DEAH box helicase n=1 Tax=Sporocytophaga myxococcoides TaxID=153721 RepID=UPI00040D5BE2|nr:DEAD/DEAH box helicase [Sporocytophaga myxococcoides]
MSKPIHGYIIEDVNFASLNKGLLFTHSSTLVATDSRGFFDIQPEIIDINFVSFTTLSNLRDSPTVSVKKEESSLKFTCTCGFPGDKLCSHQIQILYNIMDRPNLRTFFDEKLRHEKIRDAAREYGLENEPDPDELFQIEYDRRSLSVKPKLKGLFAVNEVTDAYFKEQVLPKREAQQEEDFASYKQTILVFGKHRYYDHFVIELFEAETTKDGNVRNPLVPVNSTDAVWKTQEVDVLKFYAAIVGFQNNYSETKSQSDIEGLKAVVKNPLSHPAFFHDNNISEKISAQSIIPVKLKSSRMELSLSVDLKERFHEVSAELVIEDQLYDLKSLQMKFGYFIRIGDTMHLIQDEDLARVISFFRQQNHKVLIHPSKFDAFQQNLLVGLENKFRITYSHIKKAPPTLLEEQGFTALSEKIIYLSDSENFVLITPVMKYGNVEIPILSKRQIYTKDQNGNTFLVERDQEAEVRYVSFLLRQHPFFQEQVNGDCYYLHKQRLLENDWFLDAFEEWKRYGITILGFNELKSIQYNPNKASINIKVNSGIKWFETTIDIKFGDQKVSLKQLQKSVKDKSRYIQLDNGTLGILPADWLKKFSAYFNAADIDVVAGMLKTPKTNFNEIAELYEEHLLTNETLQQLKNFRNAFEHFESIQEIEIPKELNATLRDYQKQGLNWLNFLDDFGFGGCLADDMGLGKTIQIITFILLQRKKQAHNTNLIVVPASLIFNWQEEIDRFAPSIKVHTFHGAGRIKDPSDFDNYEIIITTYGTLLSDISTLKKYNFNYIILDESQAIKNPESQRYKAACLLKSRNKLVLTGTPVENNTFDLFGQFSFVCPGLLGNKQQFKGHYSMPIDKFEDSGRAKELRQKINPFLLRRTKKQVAKELPEKTEMVLYCEMGENQRSIYDAYEQDMRDFIASRNEDELNKENMHFLKGLTRLRQLCNSTALISENKAYGEDSAKIEVLMEEIGNKHKEHKILVFSQFVSMLDLIKAKLDDKGISHVYLTGQTKERGAVINNFQNNDQVRVFLISLKAGGTGLNLTEADYVYLVDPWWNPAVENQAIDRSYRIGQQKNVVAVRLICPNTIEEKIMKLQQTKKELVNDLVKTDADIVKSLTKKELMSLFR